MMLLQRPTAAIRALFEQILQGCYGLYERAGTNDLYNPVYNVGIYAGGMVRVLQKSVVKE